MVTRNRKVKKDRQHNGQKKKDKKKIYKTLYKKTKYREKRTPLRERENKFTDNKSCRLKVSSSIIHLSGNITFYWKKKIQWILSG